MKFTDTQKLACDISRNIAVTAGAGSGKTSVLVERYLWCLQNNGYQVRRIAAITFTEKAAGEMLARIRQGVIQRISSGMGDSQRWEEVLEQLPLAHISTIHGFCQRVLREFPIEAGVDPNFTVCDEAVKHILLSRLCDRLVQQRAESDDPYIRLLAQQWSQTVLRTILIKLLEFREISLPWATGVTEMDFPTYLIRLTDFVTVLQHTGVQRLRSDGQWQEHVGIIRSLIPSGDNSKLTSRCLNILELDAEFRQQQNLAQQLTTLAMLKKELRMITPTKTWKEENRNGRLKAIFDLLKDLYNRYLPDYGIHDELEQSGFQVQQALAHLFLDAHASYGQEKTARQMLDFDDLQERARALLQQPDVHDLLINRYDFIMVDEFQDTNHLQWEIIRKFGETEHGLHKNRFCIVGDEKQSIYMFRGADVAVFGDVRQALQQANLAHNLLNVPLRIPEFGDPPAVHEYQKHGELIMAENFRSDETLIAFFNDLFSHLFLATVDPIRPYDVMHQELIAGRKASKAEAPEEQPSSEKMFPYPVELLLNAQPENSGESVLIPDEPELVALRILELTQKDETTSEHELRLNYQDIAILLRTRTRLKEFELALRRHHIPFIVAGGIGFYEQQEVYDLANLLRFLSDNRQDIALAGVLRSPLCGFSDDQLWFAVDGIHTGSRTSNHPETLWEKLQQQIKILDRIPDELDPKMFLHVYTQLNAWNTLCDRMPITHLLRRIIEDTGLYGILASGEYGPQTINNIEKLLEIARNFEHEGFQSLRDFVAYLDQLILLGEREGEAQIHTEGMDVVQLMTIHAAKGLEFPVVFVPELERPFNYSSGEAVYLDALPAVFRRDDMPDVVAGVKGCDPAQNYAPEDTVFRKYLRQLLKEKTDAEMKRLLYVACTRARSFLILSGSWSDSVPKHSWLSWLNEVFSIAEILAQQHDTLTLPDSDEEQAAVRIKIRTSEDYPQSTSTSALSPAKQDNREQLNTPLQEDFSALDILHQNLQPIKGYENTIFTVNPSTLHLLFQNPRRYYFQHILKFSETFMEQFFPVPDTEERTQEALFGTIRGTIIHRLFEKQFFDTTYGTEEQEVFIRRTLAELDVPAGFREQSGLDAAIRKAAEHYQSSGIKELLARSPQVYREYPFQLKIRQAEISGVLDVLYLDPKDRVWTILDYKSHDIEPHQIADTIHEHGYDVQLRLYALAVSRLLQVEHIRGTLFFTSPGCLYEEIDLSPTARKQFEDTLSASLSRFPESVQNATERPQLQVELSTA